jgi:hypothetical protein
MRLSIVAAAALLLALPAFASENMIAGNPGFAQNASTEG